MDFLKKKGHVQLDHQYKYIILILFCLFGEGEVLLLILSTHTYTFQVVWGNLFTPFDFIACLITHSFLTSIQQISTMVIPLHYLDGHCFLNNPVCHIAGFCFLFSPPSVSMLIRRWEWIWDLPRAWHHTLLLSCLLFCSFSLSLPLYPFLCARWQFIRKSIRAGLKQMSTGLQAFKICFGTPSLKLSLVLMSFPHFRRNRSETL